MVRKNFYMESSECFSWALVSIFINANLTGDVAVLLIKHSNAQPPIKKRSSDNTLQVVLII